MIILLINASELTKYSLAASEPFTFIVGEERREFTIHSALVANQSECLKKLVKGEFLEGTTNKVMWTHVDELTFMCFWQYVYTGDYAVQNADAPLEGNACGSMETDTDGPALESTETLAGRAANPALVFDAEPEPTSPVEDDWALLFSVKKKRDKMTKQQRLWSQFKLLRKRNFHT
ncbi:hypothetical protein PWT90_09506 [Aphanocladium album]|nr:hypothetical protein PWT90_09506 [Aphanocladium album]